MPVDDDDERADLRVSRALLRRAHALAGIGSYVVDLNRRTIRMSAELAHVFRAGDQALELPLDEYRRRFYLPADRERHAQQLEAAYAERAELQLEGRVVRGDGEIIWAQTSATFEHAADGTPLLVGVTHDVSRSTHDLLRLGQQTRKLERTTERLKLATNAAAIGTWDWDVVTGRMRWDETMFGMYGVRREDFGGTLAAWMERLCPLDRDRVVGYLQQTVARQTEWTDEFAISRPDGSVRVLRAVARIVRDAGGAVVRMVGVNYDITAQRRAEEALVASEALLLQLVKHTPAAVAMFDREMRYLQASDRWISAYHLDGQDLFGRSQYEVFPDLPPRWKEVYQRALAGAIERCDEDQIPCADGTTAWLEWEVRPWRTSAGDIGGVIIFTQVITERIRAAELLRESEARFRQIAETIDEVFWVRDPVHRRLLYVSPAFEQVWGRPVEPLTADGWPPAVLADDRSLVDAAMRALETHGGYDETYRIERPDGAVRWIHDRAYPLRDAAGELHRIVGTASDITEQRSLEAQLRQAQKMEAVGVLAGGVAHDFNNLLAVILSYSSMLLDDLGDDHPLRDDLHEIKQAGERAAQLTRQLLAFSRQQVLQPRIVDLNDVVAGTEKMLRRLIREDIELVTTRSAAPASAFLDRGQLEQVLMNLAVNARDAMPDGGRITIALTERQVLDIDAARLALKPGRFVVMSVADTGTGMDAATQGRIFEPFFTTKGPGQGTGLGLSSVFGTVHQSGGRIDVQSAPGRGTTFEIWLPLAAGELDAPAPAPAPRGPAPGGTATILVVEDDDAVRKIACTILSRHGHRVLEARDGADALRVWERASQQIDLVLTDVVMPGMNGDQLAARLQALRPGLRVLFMSGYPDRSPAGAEVRSRDRYIKKPFTPTSLLAPIIEALATLPRA